MRARRGAQAAYHGVPILALPGRVPDQPDSAAKAARLGFCLPVIMGRNFSAATVRGALERLLTEPEFREAAARVSRRLRARRRTPTEEAGGAGPCGAEALARGAWRRRSRRHRRPMPWRAALLW